MEAGVLRKSTDTLRGLISRPLLVASLEDHVKQGALIALCAEPGMGKEDALGVARVIGKQFGAYTREIDLTGLMQNTACDRMCRESRSLLRSLTKGAWCIVCVHSMPPLDERCVFRMQTYLQRLLERDCCVILSLRPEAIQVVEAFTDAYVLWADELRVDIPERLDARVAEEINHLTGGIPLLADVLAISEEEGNYEIRTGREYHDALCRLVELSLRTNLISDERRLRLAMVLLGEGSFVHLARVMGELDSELLSDISRHAPFFGLDMFQGVFSCVGIKDDSRFRSLALSLRDVCEEFSDLCCDAARLLIDEGRFRRAACILELCKTTEDAVDLVLRRSAEFVNVGRADVVRRALPQAIDMRCCNPQLRRACQALLKMVDNERLSLADIEFDPLGISNEDERNEALRISILLASRLAWQGRGTKIAPEATALTDALACDFLLHLSVTHALVEGRGHAAYHLLVCGSQFSGKDTLINRLLEADLKVAHVFMGLPCPGLSPEMRRHAMGDSCMLCYLPALTALDAVLRSGSPTFDIGDLDIRAAQMGDELVRGYFMLAGALANARCGALSHAVVKCNRAIAIAQRLGSSFMGDVARVLHWAVRIDAGEPLGAEEFLEAEHMSGGLRDLASVLELIADGQREIPEHLRELPLDRDIAWLASALLVGLAQLSPLLEHMMPPTWLVVIESMHARESDDGPRLTVLATRGEESLLPEHSIYVRMFGEFEVTVNGQRVPTNLFERRRAKSLVALACSASARSLRRADVIDAIWPECDYEQGAKRIYAATNVINRAVRDIDAECRFFAARGAEHTMSLDMTCVRCDVFEFEELARRAIEKEGNDTEVLSLVRDVQALYRGDLYVPSGDAGRVIDQRRIDLRRLYTDVLVAGAEAAYRTGSLRLATRFCEQALLADETREDAIACLVRSLSSCGRSVEARDRSKAFAARMSAIRRERANRKRS